MKDKKAPKLTTAAGAPVPQRGALSCFRGHHWIVEDCLIDWSNAVGIDCGIIWNVEGRYDRDTVPAEAGSSGWYKNSENGTVKNGYGIYLEGTDRQRIVGNLIGKCNYAGFFGKMVPFRIIMPNAHNESEGNAYVKMPGGYLRVMYPEPEMCLDLSTWQEFCGFDLTGSTPDLDIDIDTEALTMAVTVRGDLPEIHADREVTTDFFGRETGKKRAPGPIDDLADRTVRFSIDPRRLKG